MPRPLKPFEGEPLGAFCLHEFCLFAKRWHAPKQLRLLADFIFPSADTPCADGTICFLCYSRSCVFPGLMETEDREMFVTCYQRAPDFILGLLAHLGDQSRRRSLINESCCLGPPSGPKAIWGNMTGKQKYDAPKKMRQRLSNLVADTRRDHDRATKFIEERFKPDSSSWGKRRKPRKGQQPH